MALFPKKQGLYDPRHEHDACGIGAVVNISGKADHQIIEHGKQILLNLSHRGAAGADEVTGDGGGILCQIPHDFFISECEKLGISNCISLEQSLSIKGYPNVQEVFLYKSKEKTKFLEKGGTVLKEQ